MSLSLKDQADFHKVIITVTNHDNIMHLFVYIQYYFDNGENEIVFKDADPNERNRTSFSARKSISDKVQENVSGKKTFHTIYKSTGGFESARTLSNLLHNYKQIYNAKNTNNYEDELLEILDLCQG